MTNAYNHPDSPTLLNITEHRSWIIHVGVDCPIEIVYHGNIDLKVVVMLALFRVWKDTYLH